MVRLTTTEDKMAAKTTNPMSVKITGSPLKTVTGKYVRDLAVGEIMVLTKGNVILQVRSIVPEPAGTYVVRFVDSWGEPVAARLKATDVVATNRSITDDQANGYFDGTPTDDITTSTAHLR